MRTVSAKRLLACAGIALVMGCGKEAPKAETQATTIPPASTVAPATTVAPTAAPAGDFETPELGPIFVVYGEGGDMNNHFIPSGFMGDAAALKLDDKCATNPFKGATCIKITYATAQKQQGWAGIFWQDPENNWEGSATGAGYNLKGAKVLKFSIRGEKGGETIDKIGMGGKDKGLLDTGKKEQGPIKLTTAWQEMSIPLDGLDLQRIQNGFMFAIPTAGNDPSSVTFYLDDIRYEF